MAFGIRLALRHVLALSQLSLVQGLPFAERLGVRDSRGSERLPDPPTDTPQLGVTAVDAANITDLLYPLSEEDRRFREQVKALLADPYFAPREGLTIAEQAQLSYGRFKRLRDELDLRIRDVQYRPTRLATALELIGTIDGTLFTVMSIHYCLCGGSLLRHGGASAEIESYIDELDSLQAIGTFLVTELGYGNNVVALQTRADYDARTQELVISTPSAQARKFMPNTGLEGVPKLGVVMARLTIDERDCGVFPVIVRLRTQSATCPGVSIVPLGDKPGYALDNAMTSFQGVRVPKHCLLLGEHSRLSDEGMFTSDIGSRRERFLLSLEQVQLGRLCLSAVSTTAAAASSFIALRYAEQRRTFAPRHSDVNVIEYRNHQRDLFFTLASTYASRMMVNDALGKYEHCSDENHDYLFRITSATKVHVSYAAERGIRLCRERCGAAGLFEQNRISVYASQCPGMITAEADNQIALIKIARQMLQQQGYEPLKKAASVSGSLRDASRLLTLMHERERKLLKELRRNMLPAQIPGQDLFELWNDNINLAIETATAHASRLAADSLWLRAADFPNEHPFTELFRLFIYQEISPLLGYFLAEDLITRDEVKTFRQCVDRSCKTLRPSALELATAFDIPNTILRSPIASDDYVASYEALAERP